MIVGKNDILIFSFILTDQCNLHCSYCHFYNETKKEVNDFQFENYMEFIKYVKDNIHHKIQIRFSGGEPLVESQKLYEYARRAYSEIGIKPYVLTNGLLLNDEVVKNSIENRIAGFLISLENPFDVDEGSTPTPISIDRIKRYNCNKLKVLPGAVIVKNKHFFKLKEICDYFYNNIGAMPTIVELNFHAFQKPTLKELNDLEISLGNVVDQYFSKTPLELFPYIVPELSYGTTKRWLVEINGNNKKKPFEFNINNVEKFLDAYLERAYPKILCKKNDCPLFETCNRYKWVWKNKKNIYCKMKKSIYNSYHNTFESW